MTSKEALVLSIAHWERMISWAEKQDSMEIRSMPLMLKEIGETPNADHCNLCKISKEKGCKDCSLIIHGKLACAENESAYSNLCLSQNWGQWVVRAKVILEDLEHCLDKENKK